jgi:hypothetical protein
MHTVNVNKRACRAAAATLLLDCRHAVTAAVEDVAATLDCINTSSCCSSSSTALTSEVPALL